MSAEGPTLDEFLATYGGDAQSGLEKAIDDFWPPCGIYTAKVESITLRNGVDRKTGQPYGLLVVKHRILDGQFTGQSFDFVTSVSSGRMGVIKNLGAMNGVKTEDARVLLQTLIPKVNSSQPVMRLEIGQRTDKEGNIWDNLKYKEPYKG